MTDAGVGPPWARQLTGRWEREVMDSAALADNPLGDPARRPVWVHVPSGYDADASRRWPTLYLLRGHTGQVDMWANRRAMAPTFLEQLDAVGPDAIVVLVDGWTSWGGAQYLDTPAIGRYSTYLSEDVVAWVDATYRTVAAPAGRAVIGHSSGGYGALVNGLLRPDVWGGVGSHAGDALFEGPYLPDVPVVARTLQTEYAGSWDAWWADVATRGLLTRDSDFALLNMWCMAACYSASPDGTVTLPMEPDGRLRLDVWQRWLDWDPVRMIPRYADAARSWVAVWIDGGSRDDVYLDNGARALHAALIGAGVAEDRIAFEIHGGRHGGQEVRFLGSVQFFAQRLASR
ncbi:MAG: alpha/beta hydrolase [Acidimicrobiales bacterium]